MAVVAGNPFTMSMGDPSSPASAALDAPAGFKYVDRGLDEASRRYYWQLVREPVDFAATVAEVGVFGSLLGVILDAGAFDRHVTHAPQALQGLNPEVTPAKMHDPEGTSGISIQRLKESLLYLE